jgi:hypothetical protein
MDILALLLFPAFVATAFMLVTLVAGEVITSLWALIGGDE